LIKKFRITLSHNIWQHLYFKGRFSFTTINQKSVEAVNYNNPFETSLFWSNNVQDEATSFYVWQHLSVVCSQILDVGANTGLYSLVAKSNNPNSNIYCFEMVPRIFKLLNHNIAINDMKIDTYNYAISSSNMETTFYDLPGNHHHLASLEETALTNFKNTIKQKTKTITLDTFKPLKGKSIDLVKIDVEGHELEVLKGAEQVIKDYKPTVLIELKSEEHLSYLNQLFNNEHYSFYNIDEQKGLIKQNQITQAIKWNFLFLNKEHEQYLLKRHETLFS